MQTKKRESKLTKLKRIINEKQTVLEKYKTSVTIEDKNLYKDKLMQIGNAENELKILETKLIENAAKLYRGLEYGGFTDTDI